MQRSDGLGFMMRQKGELKYLTIPSFEQTGMVKHGFSTRTICLSSGLYSYLNLDIIEDDDKNKLIKDYRIFCDALDIDINNLVSSDQVHSDDIYAVSVGDRGKGILRESDIKQVDALITNDSDVALITYYADCVPLLFLDVRTPAIGLAHAGWRGSFKKIGQKTVRQMIEKFNSCPRDMLVGIGPCIKKCCYEVDEPVVKCLREAFEIWDEFIETGREGHWMLDLVKINVMQLEEVGIKKSNITISNSCTSDGGRAGSLAAIMQLK